MMTKKIWYGRNYGDVYALCIDGTVTVIGDISAAQNIAIPDNTQYVAIVSTRNGDNFIELCYPKNYLFHARYLVRRIQRKDIKTLHLRHQDWILEKLAEYV